MQYFENHIKTAYGKIIDSTESDFLDAFYKLQGSWPLVISIATYSAVKTNVIRVPG